MPHVFPASPGRVPGLHHLRHLAAGCLLLLPLTGINAQDQAVAFTGARIHTVSGAVIENGAMLVEGGKIQGVGLASELRIPSDAEVVDVSGKVIIPGLVDTHSHVGIYSRPAVLANADGNESTDPVTPQLRALDAIWPGDPGIRMAQAGGITTANIMPGSGNVIGGQTAYVKMRGDSIEEMLIDGSIGGLKMANGENPKRNYGSRDKMPQTRMAVAALARQKFSEARAYAEKRETDPDGTPVDLALEPLVEAMNGERIVHHHTHRADDILTVLRLSEEFGFRVVVQHGSEAHKVADVLALNDIPVSLIIIDSPGGKHEATGYSVEGAAILAEAGVKVALHTDDFINNSRFMLREGAMAIRNGMDETAALRALTLDPAAMMDLEDQLGSLDAGKDADFVVLSGSPFSAYTRVEQTWIDGEKVFDRSRPEDLRYATGGFGVADRYPLISDNGESAR